MGRLSAREQPRRRQTGAYRDDDAHYGATIPNSRMSPKETNYRARPSRGEPPANQQSRRGTNPSREVRQRPLRQAQRGPPPQSGEQRPKQQTRRHTDNPARSAGAARKPKKVEMTPERIESTHAEYAAKQLVSELRSKGYDPQNGGELLKKGSMESNASSTAFKDRYQTTPSQEYVDTRDDVERFRSDYDEREDYSAGSRTSYTDSYGDSTRRTRDDWTRDTYDQTYTSSRTPETDGWTQATDAYTKRSSETDDYTDARTYEDSRTEQTDLSTRRPPDRRPEGRTHSAKVKKAPPHRGTRDHSKAGSSTSSDLSDREFKKAVNDSFEISYTSDTFSKVVRYDDKRDWAQKQKSGPRDDKRRSSDQYDRRYASPTRGDQRIRGDPVSPSGHLSPSSAATQHIGNGLSVEAGTANSSRRIPRDGRSSPPMTADMTGRVSPSRGHFFPDGHGGSGTGDGSKESWSLLADSNSDNHDGYREKAMTQRAYGREGKNRAQNRLAIDPASDTTPASDRASLSPTSHANSNANSYWTTKSLLDDATMASAAESRDGSLYSSVVHEPAASAGMKGVILRLLPTSPKKGSSGHEVIAETPNSPKVTMGLVSRDKLFADLQQEGINPAKHQVGRWRHSTARSSILGRVVAPATKQGMPGQSIGDLSGDGEWSIIERESECISESELYPELDKQETDQPRKKKGSFKKIKNELLKRFSRRRSKSTIGKHNEDDDEGHLWHVTDELERNLALMNAQANTVSSTKASLGSPPPSLTTPNPNAQKEIAHDALQEANDISASKKGLGRSIRKMKRSSNRKTPQGTSDRRKRSRRRARQWIARRVRSLSPGRRKESRRAVEEEHDERSYESEQYSAESRSENNFDYSEADSRAVSEASIGDWNENKSPYPEEEDMDETTGGPRHADTRNTLSYQHAEMEQESVEKKTADVEEDNRITGSRLSDEDEPVKMEEADARDDYTQELGLEDGEDIQETVQHTQEYDSNRITKQESDDSQKSTESVSEAGSGAEEAVAPIQAPHGRPGRENETSIPQSGQDNGEEEFPDNTMRQRQGVIASLADTDSISTPISNGTSTLASSVVAIGSQKKEAPQFGAFIPNANNATPTPFACGQFGFMFPGQVVPPQTAPKKFVRFSEDLALVHEFQVDSLSASFDSRQSILSQDSITRRKELDEVHPAAMKKKGFFSWFRRRNKRRQLPDLTNGPKLMESIDEEEEEESSVSSDGEVVLPDPPSIQPVEPRNNSVGHGSLVSNHGGRESSTPTAGIVDHSAGYTNQMRGLPSSSAVNYQTAKAPRQSPRSQNQRRHLPTGESDDIPMTRQNRSGTGPLSPPLSPTASEGIELIAKRTKAGKHAILIAKSGGNSKYDIPAKSSPRSQHTQGMPGQGVKKVASPPPFPTKSKGKAASNNKAAGGGGLRLRFFRSKNKNDTSTVTVGKNIRVQKGPVNTRTGKKDIAAIQRPYRGRTTDSPDTAITAETAGTDASVPSVRNDTPASAVNGSQTSSNVPMAQQQQLHPLPTQKQQSSPAKPTEQPDGTQHVRKEKAETVRCPVGRRNEQQQQNVDDAGVEGNNNNSSGNNPNRTTAVAASGRTGEAIRDMPLATYSSETGTTATDGFEIGYSASATTATSSSTFFGRGAHTQYTKGSDGYSPAEDWFSWLMPGVFPPIPPPQKNVVVAGRGRPTQGNSTRGNAPSQKIQDEQWKDILDATETLAARYREQKVGGRDGDISISDDTINEVNNAIHKFRQHAERLGMDEKELMARVRDDERRLRVTPSGGNLSAMAADRAANSSANFVSDASNMFIDMFDYYFGPPQNGPESALTLDS